MNRFLRSVTGKFLLILINVVSVFAIVFGLIVSYGVNQIEEELGYFPQTSEDAIHDIIGIRLPISNESYALIEDAVNWYYNKTNYYEPARVVEGSFGFIEFEVISASGTQVFVSKHADTFDEWDFTYKYSIAINTKDAHRYTTVNYVDTNDELPGHRSFVYTWNVKLIENDKAPAWITDIKNSVDFTYRYMSSVWYIMGAGIMMWIITSVELVRVSGRRGKFAKLHRGLLDAVPSDLIIAMAVVAEVFIIKFIRSILKLGHVKFLATAVAAATLAYLLCIALFMCIVSRLKRRKCFGNSIIGFVVLKIAHLVRATNSVLPYIRKHLLLILVIVVGEGWLLMLATGKKDIMLLWGIEKVITVPFLVWEIVCLSRLITGAHRIANGDLEYRINTDIMRGSLRNHANDLNSVSDGMALAIDDKVKSERMKAELITNVSHDIKTPLTSIINYSDLISKEKCDNPKIAEYNEVLARQSARLKRLIGDLVEASKASTGNIDIEFADCSANVLVSQTSGEYEQKLTNAGLTLITKVPENELTIQADSRRMWRIFDNLMNNICKYAQEGTRVYLTLAKVDKNAQITFRNTSRDELNISEEELMQRFTRGDQSRHTEGNGLGLSIARSLAELQHGTLNIEIDGDLFKAILTFPLVNKISRDS